MVQLSNEISSFSGTRRMITRIPEQLTVFSHSRSLFSTSFERDPSVLRGRSSIRLSVRWRVVSTSVTRNSQRPLRGDILCPVAQPRAFLPVALGDAFGTLCCRGEQRANNALTTRGFPACKTICSPLMHSPLALCVPLMRWNSREWIAV